MVADGVNDHLLYITKHEIEAQGDDTRIIATKSGYVTASKNKLIPIDYSLYAITPETFDALYIPGGKKSIDYLLKQKEVLNFICMIYTSGKNIAIDEESMQLLEAACLNPFRSSCSSSDLKNKGIFIHLKSIPTVKYFIKAVAADYRIVEEEVQIRDTVEVTT